MHTLMDSCVKLDGSFSVNRLSTEAVGPEKSDRASGCAWLDFISLGNHTSLLRATPLSRILERAAGILVDASGDDQAYVLSRPVDRIDVFISHNWAVDRTRKFLALSLYFNVRLAALVSAGIQALMVALTAQGYLPTFYSGWSEHPRGGACRALGIPVFLVLILLGGEIRSWLRLSGPYVFLDKTCISQTNKALQRRGIRKIGAYLCKTDIMLVIYTDVYLTKLWTVYEFACFLTLHSIRHIALVPTFLSQAIFVELLMIFLGVNLAMVWEFSGGSYALNGVGLLAACPLLAVVFRMEARERHGMHERFVNFSVDRCTCSREEDRPLVYHNIAELMQAADVVPTDSSEAEALAAFNVLARAKLPGLVEVAMGRHGRTYQDLVTLSISLWGSKWLDVLVGVAHSMSLQEACAVSMTYWTLMFATGPLGLAMMSHLTRRCLHLKGCREFALIIIVGWLCAGCVIVGTLGHESLWTRSGFLDDTPLTWAFYLNLFLMAVSFGTALWMFGLLEFLGGLLPSWENHGLHKRVSKIQARRTTYKAQCSREALDSDLPVLEEIAEESPSDFNHPSDWEDIGGDGDTAVVACATRCQ